MRRPDDGPSAPTLTLTADLLRAALASAIATAIAGLLEGIRGLPPSAPSGWMGAVAAHAGIIFLLLSTGTFLHLRARAATRNRTAVWAFAGAVIGGLPLTALALRSWFVISLRGRLGSVDLSEWSKWIGALVILGIGGWSVSLMWRVKLGPARLAAALMATLGLLILILEPTSAPGLYLHLHDLAVAGGLACLVSASALFIGELPRGNQVASTPSWRLALCFALLTLAFAAGAAHWATWATKPPEVRKFLARTSTIGAALCRVLPFPSAQIAPLGQNSAIQDEELAWQRACESARTLLLQRTHRPEKPHLLIASLDAVRADVCGFLGGRAARATPFLDRFAKECVVFENARSPSVSSYLSIQATLSGVSSESLQKRGGREPLGLARHLQSHGWNTHACIPEEIFATRDATWPPADASLGFAVRLEAKHIDSMVDATLTSLRRAVDTPTFAWFHAMDAHAPYEQRSAAHGTAEFGRYLSEVSHVDSELERLWSGLCASGLSERTIFVILADHGEEFGEHGERYHGTNLYETQLRVPWMMRIPRVAPRALEAAVVTTSLPATVCDVLGIPPLPDHEARSLIPLLVLPDDGIGLTAVSDLPVPRQFVGLREQRAVVVGKLKMIHDLHFGVRELFDIEADPDERTDLSLSHPAQLEALMAAESGAMALRARLMAADSAWPVQNREDEEAHAAARRGDLRAVAPLLEGVNSADPERRPRCVDALFFLWCRHAASNLQNPFEGHSGDDDIRVAHHRIEVLAGRRDIDIRFLEGLRALDQDRLHQLSFAMLHRIYDLRGLEALRRALDPNSPLCAPLSPIAVEMRALLAIRGDASVAPDLFQDAEKAPDLVRTTLILRGLAAIGDERVFDQLTHLVESRFQKHRVTLIQQLDPEKRPDHRRWLERRWQDEEPEVRLAAAQCLCRLPQEGRAFGWAAMQFDPSPLVREHFTQSRSSWDPEPALGQTRDSPGFRAEEPYATRHLVTGFHMQRVGTPHAILDDREGRIFVARPTTPARRFLVRGSWTTKAHVFLGQEEAREISWTTTEAQYELPTSVTPGAAGQEFRFSVSAETGAQSLRRFEISSILWR